MLYAANDRQFRYFFSSMNIPISIKVCGLTRVEDIQLAHELGARYFGFIVWPQSPRGLTWEQACLLAEQAPAGQRVLVDVETPADVLAERVKGPFDYYQIHSRLDIAWATLAAWAGLAGKERLWLAPRIPPRESLATGVFEFCDTFLLDTYHPKKPGGTGETSDWSQFCDFKNLYPQKNWILAGGLNPENILSACQQSGAEAVDVNSGIESSPGIKDPVQMRAFFNAVNAPEV
jgi:phosphoribosylanthranilate isomerase